MEKLTFGKHKGKTINELLGDGEFGYIIYLYENKSNIKIGKETYCFCKSELYKEKIMHETIVESRHGNYGDRV